MSQEEIKDRLYSFSIFKELSLTELEMIVNISNARQLEKGSLVFMQEEPITQVYFVQSGKVKIFRTDNNGKEQIVSVLEAGEMFPHAGFFRKGNYPAHAEVLENSILIATSIHGFEKMLVDSPQLCIKVFRILGEKIVDLQNRLEEQISHNSKEKIILLLLRLCKSNGVPYKKRYKLITHFKNRDLANMIGTSRETVSRTLTNLKKRGYVDIDEDGLFIVDYEKLYDELI
ncbi:Crp/Fnr family transcriptional regulator [Metabacillus endolithicus]|uniref:Crp/Fnr family transcriptional regulator n=1 Tax=Metabacillus endolithicus TaxID=1535204 RepID=A0ABW5C2I3_9BACI|nr:Crp/Fnr family transcriptional regulator [Metabacillus endolithicus]UPG66282.1 Crp/Fnr family transcriptional regulator [Metabacillus endolithicus]